MSILPSFIDEPLEEQILDEVPTEYEIDFETGQLTGRKVKGKEALKVWIWLCLQTQRFKWPIYTWDYGIDIEQYVGQAVTEEFVELDLEGEIREALTINPHISDVVDFKASIQGSKITVRFTAVTDQGEVEMYENL